MKWMKVSVTTTTEAVDLVSSLFDDLGLEGVQIEDNIPLSEEDKKAMFIDILPQLPEDDKTAVVTSYVEADRDVESLLKDMKEGLLELSQFISIGEGSVSVEETDDMDWLHNWKEFFKPFRAAENIVIKPTWEELEEENKEDLVIEIDPGTAFGTGAHETTRLCIQALKRHVKPGMKLLDVGCGSGILSIIGIKLGAKSAVGTDIDPAAITAALENARVNGLASEALTIYQGNLIDEEELREKAGFEAYDLVTANILADVIIPLSAIISRHLKPGGLFISSGIIDMKKEEVQKAIESNGFEITEANEMGDWVSFTARKPLKL